MSGSDTEKLEAATAAAMEAAEAALASGATADISDLAVQRLLTAGTRLFAAKTEQENRYFSPLIDAHAVTATDAAITVSDLLHAVNLNTFDLAMWSNRSRPDSPA
ncbi:MAG: hypothetical protein GKS02_06995 [Alphaproteobacteria bacterium]|nr:hypothetical protein [Alphaproteobacteria bacterium]